MRMAERGGPDVLATIGAILGQKPPYWTTLIFLQHTSQGLQLRAIENGFPQFSQQTEPDPQY